MPQEMPEEVPPKYGEEEKEKAITAIEREFINFGSNSTQSAVLELLQKMIDVGHFGDDKLGWALSELTNRLYDSEVWGANRDNRGENLTLLCRLENGLVGKVLTVREIKEILERT